MREIHTLRVFIFVLLSFNRLGQFVIVGSMIHSLQNYLLYTKHMDHSKYITKQQRKHCNRYCLHKKKKETNFAKYTRQTTRIKYCFSFYLAKCINKKLYVKFWTFRMNKIPWMDHPILSYNPFIS
jgi:hypothetical protein